MTVDLKRYFLHDTPWEESTVTLDLSDVLENGTPIFPEAAEAAVRIRGFAGSAALLAQVSYVLRKPCDRCGEMTERRYRGEFTHTVVQSMNGGEPDGDEYVLAPDGKVELDELLREDVLLDLPGKFLCREDCKGLCPRCGKNLNQGDCGCPKQEVDPRLAALQALL